MQTLSALFGGAQDFADTVCNFRPTEIWQARLPSPDPTGEPVRPVDSATASSDTKDADLAGGAILGGIFGAAVGGPGGAALGALLGAALLGRPSRRVAFEQALRGHLQKRGVGLVSAHPGRDAEAPIWIVHAERDAKRRKLHAAVPEGSDAFAPELAADVAQRVASYIDTIG